MSFTSRGIQKLCHISRQVTTVFPSRISTSHQSAYPSPLKPVLQLPWNMNSNWIQVRNNSTGHTQLPIIYLFTKDGCTLCDEAVDLLEPYRHRFILKKVDIELEENEHWYNLYKYDIPVFHIYEEFLFKHRVDYDALEKGLEKYKHGYIKGNS